MLIFVLAVIAIALLLGLAASRPNTYTITRTTTISAPKERVYSCIADLHAWREWSAFEALDPAMQRKYSGAQSGEGAAYSWNGNNHAGSGRMEITAAAPSGHVTVTVDFTRPFKAHNINDFTLETGGDPRATSVTWSMTGTRPFLLKMMNVLVSPDRLMGSHFETGLANLKTLAER